MRNRAGFAWIPLTATVAVFAAFLPARSAEAHPTGPRARVERRHAVEPRHHVPYGRHGHVVRPYRRRHAPVVVAPTLHYHGRRACHETHRRHRHTRFHFHTGRFGAFFLIR